jgi:hypothetical protein
VESKANVRYYWVDKQFKPPPLHLNHAIRFSAQRRVLLYKTYKNMASEVILSKGTLGARLLGIFCVIHV